MAVNVDPNIDYSAALKKLVQGGKYTQKEIDDLSAARNAKIASDPLKYKDAKSTADFLKSIGYVAPTVVAPPPSSEPAWKNKALTSQVTPKPQLPANFTPPPKGEIMHTPEQSKNLQELFENNGQTTPVQEEILTPLPQPVINTAPTVSAPTETTPVQRTDLLNNLSTQMNQLLSNRYNIQNEIQKAAEAKKASRDAQLKGLLDKTNTSLDAEKATIAPQYQKLKNDQSANAQLRAKRIGEIMAKQGYSEGYEGQAEVANNVAYQGNIGALEAQKQSAYDDIERRKTNALTDYNTGVAQSIADAEGWAAENLINQMNIDRTFDYQQSRDLVADTQWKMQFDEGVREFNAAQTLEEQKFAYQKIQDAVQNAAQYTGTYNGQQTLQAKQLSADNARADAALTGVYKGNQTLAAKQIELDNQFRQGQFDWQKQTDLWNQAFQQNQFDYGKLRDSVSDQQWGKEYQLQLDKFATDKVQQDWQNKFAQGQFDYQKEMDKLQQQNYSKELKLKLDQFGFEKQQTAIDNAFRQKQSELENAYRNKSLSQSAYENAIAVAQRDREFQQSKLESDRAFTLQKTNATAEDYTNYISTAYITPKYNKDGKQIGTDINGDGIAKYLDSLQNSLPKDPKTKELTKESKDLLDALSRKYGIIME